MYTNVARVRRNGGEQAAATLSRTLEDLTRAATPCCRYDVSIVAPPAPKVASDCYSRCRCRRR